MFTAWTSHISDEKEKENFQERLRRNKDILNVVKTFIENDLKGCERSQLSLEAYDKPNWDYRQAHMNGYIKAMNNILTFVDLDKQKLPREKDDR